MGGLNNSLTMSGYKDTEGGSLLLAHNEEKVQAMRAVFEPGKGQIEEFIDNEVSRMFDKEVDFSAAGKIKNEFGEAHWDVKMAKLHS